MTILFAVVVFANAAVLFAVEPLFGKLVLPLLGGTSAVWSTCMMFFQIVLLVGYLYAHVSLRLFGVRGSAVLHLLLFSAALFTLPVGVADGWVPPVSGTPVFWLLGLLTVSLGLPFLVLSAGAPILQRWFVNVAPGKDPYVLYAASNAGSLLALLAYPVLIEPMTTLKAQAIGWSITFVVLVALFSLCAFALWRSGDGADPAPAVAQVAPTAGSHQHERLGWVLLSAVPSSLLLGTTSYLTTDVAPVPLLWIVPLALYLLTFVVAFGRAGRHVPPWLPRAARLAVIPVALVTIAEIRVPMSAALMWTLATFVLVALFCHMRLAASRPAPARLTEFYVWTSLGGLLGSSLNVLVAPVVFDATYEYPLMLVAATVLLSRFGDGGSGSDGRQASSRGWRRDLALGAGLVLGLAVLTWAVSRLDGWDQLLRLAIVLPLAAIALLSAQERPVRAALVGLGVLGLFVWASAGIAGDRTLLRARSFYGAYRVNETARESGTTHSLVHGSTLHGLQQRDPAERRAPLSYYARSGPVGDAFRMLPARLTGGRVAAVGLGSGSVACYAVPGSRWTLFEIDPVIARIARDTALFTFLADCAPDAGIVLGDARIALGRLPDRSFDLLLVDAFTSDAIPIHLLTLEALRLYASKLSDDGVMLVHVSNRHLDLQRVVGAAVRHERWTAVARMGRPTPDEAKRGATPAHWLAIAGRRANLGTLPDAPGWQPLTSGDRLWTDDYSNLLGVLRR